MRFRLRDRIQTLWVGERLSALERLCLASFVWHGHAVDLYTYGPVLNVPPGVRVCDARRILPESSIFRYGPKAGVGAGSLAGFSDVFRYKMLHDLGGWWVDTDVICLRPFDFAAPYCFAWEDDRTVNVAVLRTPAGSPLAAALHERSAAAGSNVVWGSIGPHLLTDLLPTFGLGRYTLPRHTFYPFHYGEAVDLLTGDDDGTRADRLDGAYAVHFWNEIFRREGIDKNAPFPSTSVFARLCARYAAPRPWLDRLLGVPAALPRHPNL